MANQQIGEKSGWKLRVYRLWMLLARPL
jgi:hypothetical protein